MFTRIKDFFKFLLSHWLMTLVFVFVVVIFTVPFVGGLYDKLQSRLSFLPARRT